MKPFIFKDRDLEEFVNTTLSSNHWLRAEINNTRKGFVDAPNTKKKLFIIATLLLSYSYMYRTNNTSHTIASSNKTQRQ